MGDLRASLVRVLRGDGATVGVGFAARTNDGAMRLLSCSHCVQTVRDQQDGVPTPKGVLVRPLVSPEDVGPEAIEVGVESFLAYSEGDIAVLLVPATLVGHLAPLDLARSTPTRDDPFSAYGFPPDGNPNGQWAEGRIGRPLDLGWGSGLQLNVAEAITGGFSGSPVMDENSDLVVGMVSSKWEPEGHAGRSPVAFAIPAETLRGLCDVLAPTSEEPYRDLAAFTRADAEFFYGRSRVLDDLAALLETVPPPRVLSVVGPSGSGKSSLVRAGLLSRLAGDEGRTSRPSAPKWDPIVVRPSEAEPRGLEPDLSGPRSPRGVADEWGATAATDQSRLLLVLDQFEEVFTYRSKRAADTYIAQLADLIAGPDLAATIVLVMRSSFYDRLPAYYPMLADAIEAAPSFHVPPDLTRSELTDIIAEPASRVGVSYESGLVERIVRETVAAGWVVGSEGRAARVTILPLLEVTLSDLWRAFLERRDARLTHAAYEQVGGVGLSLAYRAAEAYKALGEIGTEPTLPGVDRQRLVRRILTDLVHVGDAASDIPDSRRRRLHRELVADPRRLRPSRLSSSSSRAGDSSCHRGVRSERQPGHSLGPASPTRTG